MDLSEVVSALSLVFEVQGGTSGDGHDIPKVGSATGLAICGLVFFVLAGGLGVVVAALVLAELGWWVDWVVFDVLAAAANCGCSCN